MKAGVWMSPCGVRMTPARPSRPGSSASMLKDGSDTTCIQSAAGAQANFEQYQDRAWAALHTLWDGPPMSTVRDNKRRTLVKRGFVVAIGGAAIVVAGLSGCSSEKKSETSGDTSSASSAQGNSTVTIDGKDQAVQGTVVCSTMGENVNIAIGDATTGIGAVVSTGDSPTVHSVGLGNVNGVTLGFQENAGQGEAKAEKDGSTYKISGTAVGVDMANPMQPANKPFEIEVSCP